MLVNITIEGNTITVEPGVTCGDALKLALSGKRFKSCVAVRAGEDLLDLSTPVPASCPTLVPITLDSDEGLDILRHSTAHIMAAAVQRLFPKAKVTIGPSIEKGFYYDFDPPRPFSVEDFPAIEAEMRHIAKAALPFTRREVSKDEAIRFFAEKGETYKVEIIRDIPADTVSLYELAEFTDLCRGPHLPHTGFARALKLLSVAGAYWRGDEKNAMLSRIYGTAFTEQGELDAYLHRIEEAKRRDHRKLGKELGLFDFHEDIAPGMVFWHPKGMLVRTILEDFLRKEHLKRGYELVQGPQLLRRELWEKSGHYANYRENMYFTDIEGDVYGIKPMNCLAHMLIYGSSLRSYRELPVRYAELGVRGMAAHRRHKKYLDLAKGYRGGRSKLYRTAREAVERALTYAYRDRRVRKREFRKLWILRINAGARLHGLSYSRFINGLNKAGVALNRKVLADLAVYAKDDFAKLVELAKAKLA
ncbi:hypothetical protein B566_EDAN018748 [Ephemera danica]|nr:hypothetical protein B566_EDAN018748 [Ephemera danica]